MADVWSKLSIGGSFFSHDNIVGGTDSAFRNSAYGMDVQWGSRVGEGLYGLAELLERQGAGAAAKNKICGLQGLAAYNFRMTSPTSWLYAIEPAVRFDYRRSEHVGQQERTPSFPGRRVLHVSRAQFRAAVDQSFQASGAKSITGVRTSMTVSF